ncbi:MAG: hypothetical protein H6618_05040 [Deltaproteobacteria bacterium]|nr:hypothetical protein [Deltaproteobacteria bacterium]
MSAATIAIRCLLIIALLTISRQALFAEPWLGSRYAKNCAGCHAPQRINVKPADRRCSLSCQGCHVNPNGGGIRSFYGKWNSNRWLKSFRSDILKHDLNVAAYPKQEYAKKRKSWEKAPDHFVFEKGFSLKETDESVDEDDYYWTYGRYKTIAKNKKHSLFQIPKKDPWRQMAMSKIDGGADFRWFSSLTSIETSTDSSTEKEKQWVSFPMSADFGLRYRPLYRNLHFVMENRYWGSPAKGLPRKTFLTSAKTRSLYTMVDDLPYNIFVMGGYYRPLFGNYDPYHYGLAQRMISHGLQGNSQAYNILFEALSVGTAPNVPYLNLHKIGNRVTNPDDRTEGFALNAGLRGVRYGQSLNYSYWRSKDKALNSSTEMHSIGFMVMLGSGNVMSYEGVSITRDEPDKDFRQGGVHTLDLYLRLWRELYLQSGYAAANVTPELLPGNSSQARAGFKMFLIPGVEMSLFFEAMKIRNDSSALTLSSQGLQSQVHAYF